MKKSKIEWTETTWNPITGCTKISDGCKNCYAETMTKRLQAMGLDKYKNGFDKITFHKQVLDEPLKWKKPCNIFVCSMSDLFHEDIPYNIISEIVYVMEKTPQHTYQILTKRPERMRFFSYYVRSIPENVWVGVSVENKKATERMQELKRIIAPVRFLSCEPLLEDLGKLDLNLIDWVIVGGESGHNARKMNKEWVLNIKEQCELYHVPFFFKQWGEYGEDGVKRSKYKNGKLLNGKEYLEKPIRNEFENDEYHYAMMHDLTYDVHFNNEQDSNNKGFTDSYDDCLSYIEEYNGTNHSYFKDYKGGTVSIICNETGETVFETEVK
jgi:protein gp37